MKSGIGIAIIGLAGFSWYTASLPSLSVDAANLPAPSDLEQQLAPQHFVLAHSVPDGLLQTPRFGGTPRLVEQVVEVRKGDTLIELLVDAGVSTVEAHEAVIALEDVFSPRDLKPGQEIEMDLSAQTPKAETEDHPRLVALRLKPSVERDVQVTRDRGGGFVAEATDRPLDVELTRAAASIDSSLFEAGQAQDVPLPVMAELIRAFSFDVDFQRDIRAGDSYEILYEQYRDEAGKLVKAGDILYAALTLRGERIEIYRFTPPDGRTDYFKPNGESIRRALLRTPIDGARMSSGFGLRKHPILGYSRMHKGIDFAAPTGTPIFAAGDGVIVRIGRHGGYGNYIQIRHNSRYSTAYAHVSRFAKGLRKGSRVRQGQVIAYVGTTGQSTGPHLHYEILAGGKQINPRTVELPTGQILEAEDLNAFQAARTEIDRLMNGLRRNRVLIARQPESDCAESDGPSC